MTNCAIMQPTYLPWAGYFNLINSVDYFVFLDDVQLERQSWQTRNHYLLNGGKQLCVLPLSKDLKLSTTINQTTFAKNIAPWQKKTFRRLKAAYEHAPYGKNLLNDIYPYFIDPSMFELSLAEYNISLIKLISNKLGITTKICRSSELDAQGKRTDYLIEILKNLNVDAYIAPVGSKDYLEQDDFLGRGSCNLSFQNYNPAAYKQMGAQRFISHLSIIDVIAHMGYENTKRYIK